MIAIEEQISQLADAVDEQLQERNRPVPVPTRQPPRWMLKAAVLLLVVGGIGAVAAITIPRASEPASNSPGMTPEQVADQRDRIDQRLPLASETQQAALADGVVTVTEILDLAQEASDCSVAAGGPEIAFEWVGDGLERTVALGSDRAEVDRLEGIADRCWEERVGLAEQAVALQAVRSVEYQQRINQLVAQCLMDARIDAPDWPATDVEIDPSIEATCNDQAMALLD